VSADALLSRVLVNKFDATYRHVCDVSSPLHSTTHKVNALMTFTVYLYSWLWFVTNKTFSNMADTNQNHSRREDSSNSRRILVISIDLGTTAFTIAYQWFDVVSDPRGNITYVPVSRIELVDEYPTQKGIGTHVPTDLYYNPDGVLRSWGHTALDETDSKLFDPDLFFHNWKLELHKSTEASTQEPRRRLQHAARKLGKNLK